MLIFFRQDKNSIPGHTIQDKNCAYVFESPLSSDKEAMANVKVFEKVKL